MFYTYLVGWSLLNTYYYGVRYAKHSHPDDLFTTYFTSSKYVKSYTKTYGNPDIIQIRKVFDTSHKARQWEHRILKHIIKKPYSFSGKVWLNKTDNISIILTKEQRLIIAEKCSIKLKGRTGRKWTDKQRKDKSNRMISKKEKWYNNGTAEIKCERKPNGWNSGRLPKTNDVRNKISKSLIGNTNALGKSQTNESNVKRSLTLKQRYTTQKHHLKGICGRKLSQTEISNLKQRRNDVLKENGKINIFLIINNKNNETKMFEGSSDAANYLHSYYKGHSLKGIKSFINRYVKNPYIKDNSKYGFLLDHFKINLAH